MFEFFEMLPTEDPRSWALRLMHYGVIAAMIGLAIGIVLLLQNAYLIFALRSLRAKLTVMEGKVIRLDATLRRPTEKH